MALRGRIDGVFDGMLRGWLWDPVQPSRRLLAELSLDGQPLGRVRADQPRADLEAVGFGEGGAGFEHPIPIQAQDGRIHELLLIAEQQWIAIEVDRLSLPIPPRLHMLRGRVEGIRAGLCVGWAWDCARPQERVRVELLQQGRVLAERWADIQRPELARAGIGDGGHGFTFDLSGVAPDAELQLRCNGAQGDWLIGRVTMQGGPAPRVPKPVRRIAAKGMSRREYLVAARRAEAEQDHAAAARLLDAALLDHADDVDLLTLRARVHLAQQELEPAERLARSVLREQPGHPRALLMLARSIALQGRHEEAIKAWEAIGLKDAAFRERIVKRTRSLAALGRHAEAQQEAAMALRVHPTDPETLRHVATTADAAGALRAALGHWRRFLAFVPHDQPARERVRALEQLISPPVVQGLDSPLANPDLRNWQGPLEAWAEHDSIWPVPGLRVCALAGRAFVTPVSPWQHRPGELPGYGLLLRAEPADDASGGAEIGFALASVAGSGGLRMGLEVTGLEISAGLGLTLALRCDAGERVLRHLALEPRARLHRFDMTLTEDEERALDATGLELLVRLEGAGTVRLHPPRALSRLRPSVASAGQFETPGLALPLPAPERPAESLADLGSPFTSVVVMPAPEALAATIQGVLGGTAAPFECVLTIQPGWPAPLVAALRALAARDPRFRLLPPGSAQPTGWVALMEAAPRGGREWLTELHRMAAVRGSAEAPGVLLARSG